MVLLFYFLGSIIVASLAEYWIHRLMHLPLKLGERHRDHHRRNEGQGVALEFWDYFKGGLITLPPFYLISIPVGLSWTLGSLLYAMFTAYAHQLQHENPRKCFWMKMPVHYVHHKYGMWSHNFGLAVDWWDYVFGTYKAVDWLTEEELSQPERGHLQLRWW